MRGRREAQHGLQSTAMLQVCVWVCVSHAVHGVQLYNCNAVTGARDPSLIEDLVWNLRTWPLELIEWETLNSHRLDITFNPEQDR